MSTLHNSHRTRLPAITLLTLVVAHFAAPAFGGIEVEVRGVGEDIRANILAYLSFERYKTSDDLSPELLAAATEKLLAAGALDVFVAPIQMKKGRLAFRLTVLTEPARANEFARLILKARFRLSGRGVWECSTNCPGRSALTFPMLATSRVI